MDKAQKTKVQNATRRANVLESLKDFGQTPALSFAKRTSGEIHVGETLNFSDLISEKHEENIKLKRQIAWERKLAEEERTQSAKKTNELKVQLQALMQEILALAKSTQNLGGQVEIAAMQAPAQPGIYHLIFFEKLLEFITGFRKKIESASTWLEASNKRAEKKNFWAMYKKKGSSFLLSGESYSQRSAG